LYPPLEESSSTPNAFETTVAPLMIRTLKPWSVGGLVTAKVAVTGAHRELGLDA
jgi:hypothetical protein